MKNVVRIADRVAILKENRTERVVAAYTNLLYPRLFASWSGFQLALRSLGAPEYDHDAKNNYHYPLTSVTMLNPDGTQQQHSLLVHGIVETGGEQQVFEAIDHMQDSLLCHDVLPGVSSLAERIEAPTTYYCLDLSPAMDDGESWAEYVGRPAEALPEEAIARMELHCTGAKVALTRLEEVSDAQIAKMDAWAHAIGAVAM